MATIKEKAMSWATHLVEQVDFMEMVQVVGESEVGTSMDGNEISVRVSHGIPFFKVVGQGILVTMALTLQGWDFAGVSIFPMFDEGEFDVKLHEYFPHGEGYWLAHE